MRNPLNSQHHICVVSARLPPPLGGDGLVLPPPPPVELVVGIMAIYHSLWWWLPLMVLITARIIAFVVYGIWWCSLKLLYFAWVSMHSLWSCGCIDCFCSASFDFQDIWASDGLPLGNLEKLGNKHGCGPPNFGPYHPTRGGGPLGTGHYTYMI